MKESIEGAFDAFIDIFYIGENRGLKHFLGMPLDIYASQRMVLTLSPNQP